MTARDSEHKMTQFVGPESHVKNFPFETFIRPYTSFSLYLSLCIIDSEGSISDSLLLPTTLTSSTCQVFNKIFIVIYGPTFPKSLAEQLNGIYERNKTYYQSMLQQPTSYSQGLHIPPNIQFINSDKQARSSLSFMVGNFIARDSLIQIFCKDASKRWQDEYPLAKGTDNIVQQNIACLQNMQLKDMFKNFETLFTHVSLTERESNITDVISITKCIKDDFKNCVKNQLKLFSYVPEKVHQYFKIFTPDPRIDKLIIQVCDQLVTERVVLASDYLSQMILKSKLKVTQGNVLLNHEVCINPKYIAQSTPLLTIAPTPAIVIETPKITVQQQIQKITPELKFIVEPSRDKGPGLTFKQTPSEVPSFQKQQLNDEPIKQMKQPLPQSFSGPTKPSEPVLEQSLIATLFYTIQDSPLFFKRLSIEVLSKFYSCFFGSNLGVTLKAQRLLTSLSNYSKNDIKKKDSRRKNFSDCECQSIDMYKEHAEMHDIVSINVIAQLFLKDCLYFKNDNDLDYNREIIEKLKEIKTELNFDSSKLVFSDTLVKAFKANPREVILQIVTPSEPPRWKLVKEIVLEKREEGKKNKEMNKSVNQQSMSYSNGNESTMHQTYNWDASCSSNLYEDMSRDQSRGWKKQFYDDSYYNNSNYQNHSNNSFQYYQGNQLGQGRGGWNNQ